MRYDSRLRNGALGLLWLVLAGCAVAPPEEALRQRVDALQAAIAARDAGALAEHLADDFIGPGGMDRDAARRTAALYFLQNARVGVAPGPLDIRLEAAHARVDFTAALTGGSGRLLPERGRIYRVETGWRLEDGEWRLTSADWKPVL